MEGPHRRQAAVQHWSAPTRDQATWQGHRWTQCHHLEGGQQTPPEEQSIILSVPEVSEQSQEARVSESQSPPTTQDTSSGLSTPAAQA